MLLKPLVSVRQAISVCSIAAQVLRSKWQVNLNSVKPLLQEPVVDLTMAHAERHGYAKYSIGIEFCTVTEWRRRWLPTGGIAFRAFSERSVVKTRYIETWCKVEMRDDRERRLCHAPS
jgi:hypothetical protein